MNVTALAPRMAAPVARTDNLDTLTVARMLAESGFFGEVRDAGKALAKILAGQELGMGPIASLMGVYYQQGKVTYSANIMAAAIQRSGIYTYRIRKHDATICDIEFFERGESVGRSSFSIDEARQASLLQSQGKGNWEKFPRNMLFARAMSNGAKWFCAGVFGGVTPYTPDELGAEVAVGEDGDMKPVQAEVVEMAPPIEPLPASSQDRATFEANWKKGVARAVACGIAPDDKPGPDATKAELRKAQADLLEAIQAREKLNAEFIERHAAVRAAGGDIADMDPTTCTDTEVYETLSSLNEMLAPSAGDGADDMPF
jgi:hypothetical protein